MCHSPYPPNTRTQPTGPKSKPASTFLLPIYTKYRRERSMLNDLMEMISKVLNKANSTGLTTQFIQKIC